MWWLINLISGARRWRWTRFQLAVALLRKAWDILKKNVGTKLKLFWLRVFNIRFFQQCILQDSVNIPIFSFYWKTFKWSFQIWLKCIYIFLCEKVTETITVHENGCSNIFFWRIETNAWIKFGRKFFLFIHLIPIRMFRLLKL